jgi:hypothetical protein
VASRKVMSCKVTNWMVIVFKATVQETLQTLKTNSTNLIAFGFYFCIIPSTLIYRCLIFFSEQGLAEDGKLTVSTSLLAQF